jgi:hypothetical protein
MAENYQGRNYPLVCKEKSLSETIKDVYQEFEPNIKEIDKTYVRDQREMQLILD